MAKLSIIGARVGTINHRRVAVLERSTAPIYQTAEYKEWREEVISRAQGYCQDPQCERPNRKPRRLFADHIVEIQDGGARFDPANGMARCGGCHTRKTARERAKRFGISNGQPGS